MDTCTKEIVDVAMRIVSKDVRSPKVIRDHKEKLDYLNRLRSILSNLQNSKRIKKINEEKIKNIKKEIRRVMKEFKPLNESL